MKYILQLRPISKKNSRRWIKRGGKKFLVPSARYENFLSEATYQLMQHAKLKRFTGQVSVHTDLYIKGKYRVDGDNLHTSILDVLQHVGILTDDELVMRGSYEKHPNRDDWSVEISISNYGGQ
jgi:Holliday junction resolvase RusA-like endonuclease